MSESVSVPAELVEALREAVCALDRQIEQLAEDGKRGIERMIAAVEDSAAPPPSLPDRDEAPSISDEAEAREDRVTGRLKNHDPAELNTLANIVTGNAGERHPLFSVRYGIAVAILESDWLRDRLDGATKENNHE